MMMLLSCICSRQWKVLYNFCDTVACEFQSCISDTSVLKFRSLSVMSWPCADAWGARSTLSIYLRSFTKNLNHLKLSEFTKNHSELCFINRRFIKWINLDFEAARTADSASSLYCVSTYKLIWASFVMQSLWWMNQAVFTGYWSFSCLRPWDLMFNNSLLV